MMNPCDKCRVSVFAAERRFRRIVALLFASLLVAGILLYRDYGVSWDESAERNSGIASALCALNMLNGTPLSLTDVREVFGGDCYYGMGFQHLLLAAEYLTHGGRINLSRQADGEAWYLRHLLTFVFVWCGLIALFFSGKLLWRRDTMAFVPVALFLLIPRFWAESFYNCKDMVMLASVMIAGYCLLRLMKYPRFGNALLFGVAAAFSASIRLPGGALFLAGAAAVMCTPRLGIGRRIALVGVSAAVAGAALILFYPISWTAPVTFFIESLNYMRSHPWNGGVLFFGREYTGSQVPWYYVPGWMAVTLPIPLMLLFFWGHWAIFRRRGSRFAAGGFFCRSRLLLIFFFWVLLAAVVVGCRTCYNGWRQFYFLAWPIVLVAADGVDRLCDRRMPKAVVKTAKVLGIAWLACTVAWMVCVHPWQNLFFNLLAGDPNGRFELDYWQIADRDALRLIADSAAQRGKVVSVALNAINDIAVTCLEDRERERLRIVPQEDFCDCYIYHVPPQWRHEQGGRPFEVRFPTGIRKMTEVNVRSSLFIHPVLVYRVYEFFAVKGEGAPGNGK